MKNIIRLNSIFISINGFAQSPSVRFKECLKIDLNSDRTKYIKGISLAQVRLRHNDNSLSATIYRTSKKETFVGELRLLSYQISSQFSSNSFNNLSSRKFPLFFHDVSAKYNGDKNFIPSGVRLKGWNGTLRYTSLGVGNVLCLDMPTINRAFVLGTLVKEPILNSDIKN